MKPVKKIEIVMRNGNLCVCDVVLFTAVLVATIITVVLQLLLLLTL